ncbi:MAG: DUF1799 domain-containing protein [Kangiella sp.]|nr:DUF1799 domain-containing protein [Kangiella sp.]MCW9029666.1 DUF1799 domain-containing protein [Kangiella sp.]
MWWLKADKRGRGKDEAVSDLEDFGAPQEVINQFRQPQQKKCEVWNCNWESLMCFLKVQTQWRRHPVTGILDSLDYDAVIRTIKLFYKKSERQRIFSDIQTMEHTILTEVHK